LATTATGYTGDQSLTFGGASTIGSFHPTLTSKTGTAVNFGIAETISFTERCRDGLGREHGVMTLYTTENATITATDGSISSAGLSVTVSASVAASLALSAATTTPTAGVADNLTIGGGVRSRGGVRSCIPTPPGTVDQGQRGGWYRK
jgi:hypothetical protein